jgi:two-component system response regulator
MESADIKMESADILLAEDSDADAEMTIRALRKGRASHKIIRVHDGVEALEFIFRTGAYSRRPDRPPKVILLDLKMPRVGGIEVLQRIKADEHTKPIPVVILTSSAEEQDLRMSYQLGVNSYLVKPMDFSAFSTLVSQAGSYWATHNRVLL